MIDLAACEARGIITKAEARRCIAKFFGIELDEEPEMPTQSELVGVPMEQILAADPGVPSWEKMLDALRDAGYDNPEAAAIKWHLVPYESLSDERKMERYAAVSKYRVQAKPPAADSDTSKCPFCGKVGDLRTANNEAYYVCSDKECARNPNGRHTTWNQANWFKKKGVA